MKVLFIFHDSERNNGANHSMMDIIDYLAKFSGVEPYIAFPKKKGTAIEYANNCGYKVYKLRYGRWDFPLDLHGRKKFIYGVKWIVKLMMTVPSYFILKREIKRESIQVVYTNTYTTFIGSWLRRSLKILHIWHIREFGKEDHNLKIVGGDSKLYAALNGATDKIIFISKSIQEKYLPYIQEKDKCVVLYNDISESRCNILARWDNTNEINILIAGTLQEGKGQLEAIKAIDILNTRYGCTNIRLYIAGKTQGDYYKVMEKYVQDRDLTEKVSFLGYVSEMTELREKMHFGVVCSSNEAFGRVTVEGMLTGMLMIGADAAGTRELIKDGHTGYLYKLGNPDALAAQIFECCQHMKNTEFVAQNGYQYALSTYAKHHTSKEIETIIRKMYM
uniref:glycosyltransferase family 4 protein n=1 Tax=Enterocloster clostridioformis TaxID=1531 RepID=UPI0026EDB4A4|nr:glycosyltransferase family 4 protein [Enterocloster clostridioformis]